MQQLEKLGQLRASKSLLKKSSSKGKWNYSKKSRFEGECATRDLILGHVERCKSL